MLMGFIFSKRSESPLQLLYDDCVTSEIVPLANDKHDAMSVCYWPYPICMHYRIGTVVVRGIYQTSSCAQALR